MHQLSKFNLRVKDDKLYVEIGEVRTYIPYY